MFSASCAGLALLFSLGCFVFSVLSFLLNQLAKLFGLLGSACGALSRAFSFVVVRLGAFELPVLALSVAVCLHAWGPVDSVHLFLRWWGELGALAERLEAEGRGLYDLYLSVGPPAEPLVAEEESGASVAYSGAFSRALCSGVACALVALRWEGGADLAVGPLRV